MKNTLSLKNRLALITTSLIATGFFAVATPSFAHAATNTHTTSAHSQTSEHKNPSWDYCDYHYCFVDTYNNYPYDGQSFFPHNFVYSTEVVYSIIVGTYPSVPLY